MKNLTALMLCTTMIGTGCASRPMIESDNPIKSASNLYNRNFVVAAPTLLGNLICGAPFAAATTIVDSVYTGNRTDHYYKVMNNISLVPASVCGAITGLVFIPFSYACGEDPWDIGFKTTHNMSWSCK